MDEIRRRQEEEGRRGRGGKRRGETSPDFDSAIIARGDDLPAFTDLDVKDKALVPVQDLKDGPGVVPQLQRAGGEMRRREKARQGAGG